MSATPQPCPPALPNASQLALPQRLLRADESPKAEDQSAREQQPSIAELQRWLDLNA